MPPKKRGLSDVVPMIDHNAALLSNIKPSSFKPEHFNHLNQPKLPILSLPASRHG
jgi:hypothetical protein